MCGIAGIVRADVASPDLRNHPIHRMLESVAHRGPDESKPAAMGRAVFGTARLALVDKPTSAQPMSDTGDSYLLSFNGEIYNHRELRSELESLGVRFRTSGDTEVLLYVLIQWGVAGLRRLKGQFAVALWDSVKGELLLARDRFGIVPLFWTQPVDGELAFASEVKAFCAAGLSAALSVADVVDAGVLWGLHPGRSAYAGIQSVPPGGYVKFGPHGMDSGRYWRFAFAEERDDSSLAEQATTLGGLLSKAVERRLPAYGDPAVLLSGGLDSSAVLAMLRRSYAGRIDSYSIQFAQAALNESPFQALAAAQFQTLHTSITCDDVTVAESLVRTIEHTELPLVRTAPASSISLAARIEQNHTRAVLSGEGADELFCGYDLFKVAYIRDAWSKEPDSTAWPERLSEVMQHQRDLGRAVERAFYEQGLDRRGDPLFSHLNRWSASYKMTRYLSPALRELTTLEGVYEGVRRQLPAEYHGWSAVEQAQYLEVTYFLASALLASQCDRAYMAHSIEARYPFLDEDLADFALTLPQDAKLNGRNEKVVLKQAVAAEVPREITERVKQPYTAPEGNVFRSAPGKDLLNAYLTPSAIEKHGIFDAKRVDWLVNKLGRSPTSFHDDLAILWMLSTQVLADRYGVANLNP
jgi:asparagine synthase (glutamine-hydrolysing)